jgi:hypothetical protein
MFVRWLGIYILAESGGRAHCCEAGGAHEHFAVTLCVLLVAYFSFLQHPATESTHIIQNALPEKPLCFWFWLMFQFSSPLVCIQTREILIPGNFRDCTVLEFHIIIAIRRIYFYFFTFPIKLKFS